MRHGVLRKYTRLRRTSEVGESNRKHPMAASGRYRDGRFRYGHSAWIPYETLSRSALARAPFSVTVATTLKPTKYGIAGKNPYRQDNQRENPGHSRLPGNIFRRSDGIAVTSNASLVNNKTSMQPRHDPNMASAGVSGPSTQRALFCSTRNPQFRTMIIGSRGHSPAGPFVRTV
jgi:hypothetical protein